VTQLTPTKGDTQGGLINCTVNTFGFGSNHNADLLKSIATSGGGLYFYIANKDTIGEAFVECMGGLLSVVGQDLKLTFTSEDAEIVDVLTIYPKLKEGKKTTISIRDIQSEESRDLLVKVKLNAEKEKKDSKLISANLTYFSMVGNIRDETSCNVVLSRPDPDSQELKDVKVDFNLDKQRNRIVAAEALSKANDLGGGNDLEKARKILNETKDFLSKSLSGKDEFVVDLIRGLDQALNGLRSQSDYSSYGQKAMGAISSAHYQQRSNMQVQGYANKAKLGMQSSYAAFKKK